MTHLDSVPGDILRLTVNYLKPRYEISDLEIHEYEKQHENHLLSVIKRIMIKEGNDSEEISGKYSKELHVYPYDTFNGKKIEKWIGIFKMSVGNSMTTLRCNYIWIDKEYIESFTEYPILKFAQEVRANIDACLKLNVITCLLYDSINKCLLVVNNSSDIADSVLNGELIEKVLGWLEHIQNRTPMDKFIANWK